MRKGFKIVVSFLISYIVGTNLFFIIFDSSFLQEFPFGPVSTILKPPLFFIPIFYMGLIFSGPIAVLYFGGTLLVILAIAFIVYKYSIEFLLELLRRPLFLVIFILMCITAVVMLVLEQLTTAKDWL